MTRCDVVGVLHRSHRDLSRFIFSSDNVMTEKKSVKCTENLLKPAEILDNAIASHDPASIAA